MRAGSRGVGPSEPPDAAARDATAQGISADHFTRPRLRPSMGQEMLLKRSSKNAPSARALRAAVRSTPAPRWIASGLRSSRPPALGQCRAAIYRPFAR